MSIIKKILFNYWPLLVIVVITSLFLLLRLGRDYLDDWDECIYAQYAKEMKETGHFMTYRWNNRKVLEKPPLYGWLMQIPYFFGVNEFTARILSVVFAITIITYVYLFAKNFFSNYIALLSILLLFASPFFLSSMKKVNTDLGFAVFTFLGFYYWTKSINKYKYSYLAGLFFGLAVLHKGINVLLYMMTILLSIAFLKKRKVLSNFIKMSLVFLITIIPWHIYQLVVHGKIFIREYFLDNLYTRTLYSIFPEESKLFYLDIIVKDLSPWHLFIIILMAIKIIKSLRKKKLVNLSLFKNFDSKKYPLLITILMAIIPLILLSIAKTRLNGYLIPIYPFITILIGLSISEISGCLWSNKLWGLIIGLLILQAIITMSIKTDIMRTQRKFTPSHDVFINIKNYKSELLEYLVDPHYRNLFHHRTEKVNISSQFIYGQKPCVAFYSQKKITLYYSTEKFKKRFLDNKKGLFLINKKDNYVINDLSINILYQNDDYLVFEN